MVFNDTTTDQGICQQVDFTCGTDTDSFPLADKVRMANRWAYKAVAWARRASRAWKVDDPNHSSLDIARNDLVAGQGQYTLDPTITSVEIVSVLDNNGDERILKPIDPQLLGMPVAEYKSVDGTPEEFFLIGDTITVKPAPAAASVTTTNGLIMKVGREIDAFTAADTTQEPPLVEDFHEIIPLGISADYLTIHGEIDKANALMARIHELREEMENFYTKRNYATKNRIIPAHNRNSYI